MARGMQQAPTPPQLQPVTVEDIIQTDVVTAERDTPIRTIVAQMAERDVGTVLVVEEDQPIGVITDRQVALALEETPDLTERTAEELLSDELLTGRIDMNLFEVIQQLNEANVRRLPIVDDDNTLVGIVSLDDVLVVLGVELRNAVDIIKAQSPRM
jgi:CBS domain-containing protein